MTLSLKQTVRFAIIAGATLAIAACASTPKPQPAPPPPPQAYTPPPPPPPSGPVPGSLQDFVINVGDRVYFDYNAFDIRADAAPVLEAQAAWLNRYREVQLRIEGNADERGTEDYNFALAARRANSVRQFLIAHGVMGSRISTVSYGKDRPIDPGEGEEHWAHNRNGHTALISGTR